jgi:hypothetical protein
MGIRDIESEQWTKWITTLVAVATALFTIASFAYKELIAPNTAPVNIALGMSIDPKVERGLQVSQKDLDLAKKAGKYSALYVKVNATNASNKTLILTKPYWLVFGRHKPPETSGETNNTFVAPLKLIRAFNKSYGNPFDLQIPRLEVERNAYNDVHGPSVKNVTKEDQELLKNQTRELIAAGELVAQREMKPGEKLETQRVIFVNNESGYDFLETRVYIPSLIIKGANRSLDHLFYAFLQRPDVKPWEEKDFQGKPSAKVNALALVSLINSWCERPLAQTLKSSTRMNGVDFVNMLQLKRLQKNESVFCPAESSSLISPYLANRYLSSDQMSEAGAQFFTATSEVLLLK